MRRDTTTEVALVGVRGAVAEPSRVGGPYRVAVGDPLQDLVEGFVARWAEGDEAAFEVAALTLAARAPELPDYYLVVGTSSLEGGPFEPAVLRRHWYFGLLHGLRPGRVAPGDDVIAGIRSLGSGPWWPSIPEIVEAARRFQADSLLVGQAPSA